MTSSKFGVDGPHNPTSAAAQARASESLYNEPVSVHIIRNRVPTPEEMAELLGINPDRVEAIRRIMSAPVKQKSSAVTEGVPTARRKASYKLTARRPVKKS